MCLQHLHIFWKHETDVLLWCQFRICWNSWTHTRHPRVGEAKTKMATIKEATWLVLEISPKSHVHRKIINLRRIYIQQLFIYSSEIIHLHASWKLLRDLFA